MCFRTFYLDLVSLMPDLSCAPYSASRTGSTCRIRLYPACPLVGEVLKFRPKHGWNVLPVNFLRVFLSRLKSKGWGGFWHAPLLLFVKVSVLAQHLLSILVCVKSYAPWLPTHRFQAQCCLACSTSQGSPSHRRQSPSPNLFHLSLS